MKKIILMLALAVVACANAVGLDTWAHSYQSVAWSYRYSEPGWTEVLESMSGSLYIERRDDSARVRSDGPLVGSFLGYDGADSVRGTNLLWPEGLVVRGTVQEDDSSFWFVTATQNAWVLPGKYLTTRDTITYLWVSEDSVNSKSFRLEVKYARR